MFSIATTFQIAAHFYSFHSNIYNENWQAILTQEYFSKFFNKRLCVDVVFC